MTVHHLDITRARRLAAGAQLLDAHRPADLVAVVEQADGVAVAFDRLLHDRVRAQDLFGFEYALEMYKPAAKRRWGYFALPVLYQERVVGKLDAKADRKSGRFQIHAIHQDVPFDAAITRAVHAELEQLVSWLDLELVGV